MNPQTGKAHGRAARRNGSKAHGRAAHGDGDDETINGGGGEYETVNGFELPHLNDQRNTLRCAVSMCAANYSRV